GAARARAPADPARAGRPPRRHGRLRPRRERPARRRLLRRRRAPRRAGAVRHRRRRRARPRRGGAWDHAAHRVAHDRARRHPARGDPAAARARARARALAAGGLRHAVPGRDLGGPAHRGGLPRGPPRAAAAAGRRIGDHAHRPGPRPRHPRRGRVDLPDGRAGGAVGAHALHGRARRGDRRGAGRPGRIARAPAARRGRGAAPRGGPRARAGGRGGRRTRLPLGARPARRPPRGRRGAPRPRLGRRRGVAGRAHRDARGLRGVGAVSGPTEGARVGRAPTLRRRLGWALVVAGVILLGVLATSAVALSRVLTLQHDVTGPFFDAVTEADAAYVGLLDAEVAVRAYVATGDDTALEAYVRAVEVDAAGVVPDPALVDRLDLDDELAAALARADASVRAWVVDYAEPAIATTEDDGPGRVRAADQADGALLFAAARADTAQYVDLLRAEREERLAALDRWSRALFGSVLVLVGSALAVGIILWVCLKRWVTEPMPAPGHCVRLVSPGSLDGPVTTSGPAEIADLAQDVEHMRVELVNQVAQIKASHEDAARSHELLAERTRELERSNRDLEQFAYVA